MVAGICDQSTSAPAAVSSGQQALVAGVASITIAGLTTSNKAQVTRASIAGTLGTGGLVAVCTANTLTITSISTLGVTQSLDTSLVNYTVS